MNRMKMKWIVVPEQGGWGGEAHEEYCVIVETY